jgi:hypothetical protein
VEHSPFAGYRLTRELWLQHVPDSVVSTAVHLEFDTAPAKPQQGSQGSAGAGPWPEPF